MTDNMRIQYDQVEEMISAFTRGLQSLDQAVANMQQASAIIQQGALVGNEGDNLQGLITQRIIPILRGGSDKFTLMISDLHDAIDVMRKADENSANQFS